MTAANTLSLVALTHQSQKMNKKTVQFDRNTNPGPLEEESRVHTISNRTFRICV